MSDRRIVLVAALLVLGSWSSVGADEPSRFSEVGRLPQGHVDWVSSGLDRVAFGSGSRVFLGTNGAEVRVDREIELDRPALAGLVAGGRLYLSHADGSLELLSLDAPEAGTSSVQLDPPFRGRVQLAQMDDYLVIAEDGFGLRIFALPHEPGHDHVPGTSGHAAHLELQPIGFLRLAGAFTAIAASTRTVLVAIDGEGVAVVDAVRPDAPTLARVAQVATRVEALAASGHTAYALGADGLRILDLSEVVPSPIGFHPEVSGSSLYLAGRRLYVAGDARGLLTYRDEAAEAITIPVSVGDFFFNPLNVSISVGDTVDWTKPSTFSTHNVFSCNGVQAGCSSHPGGTTANETFVSGAPVTAPFNFQHTFLAAGANPYLCQTHQFSASMRGSVTVTAAAPPPPGVPTGESGTTPVTVAKTPIGLDPNRLRVFWDATTCTDADGYQLIFGSDAQLPSGFGGTYSLAGSLCSIGTAGVFAWTGSAQPNPAPGQFFWFLIVANVAAGDEGSWSQNSGAVERTGPGTGGSSGLVNGCSDAKELTSTCP